MEQWWILTRVRWLFRTASVSFTPSGTLTSTTSPFIAVLFSFSDDGDGVDYHDLTDGAGHGVLIATDNIYFTLYSTCSATGTATTSVQANATLALLYRFKRVNLQEYIGIVQSQQ